MATNPFDNLNFDQQSRIRLSPRTIFLISVLILYVIAWWVIPIATLFWLGLLLVLGLAWLASYGSRQALKVLHNLIHLLETI